MDERRAERDIGERELSAVLDREFGIELSKGDPAELVSVHCTGE
ncbi:hypothetical protein OKJ48_16120 [Streptomyces kunmingensis]|uniref:Uncharacterized protein n=1 Tax=Streptomyces kunmingensis TaxID=68225 RepID=A0ABU6CAN0_9ACTN|nr:hypothetical protein [Streptomyces kunmingensis]MEB3961758.1 hypothetical protein [Streptomyces kunmingensis]